MQDQSSRSWAQRTSLMAAIFFIIALLVRLLYLYQYSSSPFYDPQSVGLDAVAFDKMAMSIAGGDWLGQGAYLIMPGYGYFLGIVYAIFGHSFTAAYLANCFLGAATVSLLYVLAKCISDSRVAIVAAVMAILSQSMVFYGAVLIGETLTIFLTVALLLVLVSAIAHGNWLWFLLSGMLLGLGVLCRATPALFLVFFAPWYFICERKNLIKKVLPHLAALVIGAIIVIAPVTIRNYVAGGEFVLVSAHGGVNFYLGYNPKAKGGYQPLEELGGNIEAMRANTKKIAENDLGRELKLSEVSAYWRNRAVDYIISNPKRSLYLAGIKVLRFFNHFELGDMIEINSVAEFSWLLRYGLIPFGFFAPFAMLGVGLSIRRKRFGPLFLFVLANLIAVVMTIPNSRYRLTSVPFLIFYAGVALVWFKDNYKYAGRMVMGIVALLLCFLIVYNPIVGEWGSGYVAARTGRAYFRLKKYDLAEPELQRAVEMDPSLIDARMMLGHIFELSRRYDRAEEQFNAILKLEPDDPNALAKLGIINYHRGDLKTALKYWKRSLQIDPDQPLLRKVMNETKLKEGESSHSPVQEQ